VRRCLGKDVEGIGVEVFGEGCSVGVLGHNKLKDAHVLMIKQFGCANQCVCVYQCLLGVGSQL